MDEEIEEPIERFDTARDYVAWQAADTRARYETTLEYSSEFELLERHGETFRMSELTGGLQVLDERKCFMNAMTVVRAHPDRFRYVEGVAGHPGGSAFAWHPHAWVVDQDGRAFDVTWPWLRATYSARASSYFGAAIPTDVAGQLLPLRNGRGVFAGDELLRQPYPPTTERLPTERERLEKELLDQFERLDAAQQVQLVAELLELLDTRADE